MRHRTKRIVKWVAGCLILTAVVWGSIIYGPEVWERIKGLGDSGEPSISELVNNPAQYNGMNVTVKGDLTFRVSAEGAMGAMWLVWGGDDSIGIIIDINTSFELGWGETGRVRVTGIFQAPNRILARRLEKA